MADLDDVKGGRNFFAGTPIPHRGFFVQGAHSLDWGMKNRLAQIFDARSGRTLMLAIDHGYFQGPTTGLERIDVSILPLLSCADALMVTRGVLRTSIPPEMNKPIVLRCTAGQSVLKELSNESLSVAADDAARLNASAMAAQAYVGAQYEHESICNVAELVDRSQRTGIPVLGVTGIGKDMARDARYLGLATRIVAEIGAHFVKTYYCEPDFEDVVLGCPVPIVVAGGKKLSEIDALWMAFKSIDQGAAGVDMGRNIFQAEHPLAMIQAVRAIVHGNARPEYAFDLYCSLKENVAAPISAVS
ncbi:MAG TPA: 3-hydroxy-5-phosphonooxypentane-2,4-dione thiolase [Candidatus Obscuribacterales bacterium]